MIEIDEAILPKVTVVNERPHLEDVPNTRGTYGLNEEQKALFYFEEALGKLALAKYWSEQS